jgi:acetyl esterase/lipase
MLQLTPTLALPVRVYGRPPAHRAVPLVLHLHGGAFQGRFGETGRVVPALLAGLDAVVVSLDYPQGPEHPFPAPLEAAYLALGKLYRDRARWAGKGSPLFVAGEDCGGNLAAGLALMARDRQGPPLAGQILFSPMLDPSMATCSARTAEIGPTGCKWAVGWMAYLGSFGRAPHPYAAPSGATRLGGLAPALVLTAEDDPMRDESLRYLDCLRQKGVAVQSLTIPAPSHWPEALNQPATPEPAWTAEVRAALRAFFATTAGPAPSPNSASSAPGLAS